MGLVLFTMVFPNQAPSIKQKTSPAKPSQTLAQSPGNATAFQQSPTISDSIKSERYYYPPQAAVEPHDELSFREYIFIHESGNDLTRTNSSGCLGLGQACPGSKLLAVCPALDYNCELSFFTNYMLNRYGSWQNAYYFWIRTDPRPYPGHWW